VAGIGEATELEGRLIEARVCRDLGGRVIAEGDRVVFAWPPGWRLGFGRVMRLPSGPDGLLWVAREGGRFFWREPGRVLVVGAG